MRTHLKSFSFVESVCQMLNIVADCDNFLTVVGVRASRLGRLEGCLEDVLDVDGGIEEHCRK